MVKRSHGACKLVLYKIIYMYTILAVIWVVTHSPPLRVRYDPNNGFVGDLRVFTIMPDRPVRVHLDQPLENGTTFSDQSDRPNGMPVLFSQTVMEDVVIGFLFAKILRNLKS